MGCALLAPVSSSLQLTTEVCLIPSISVKNGPVLPSNPFLKRWAWLDGMLEDSGKETTTQTTRRGATLNEIGWRANEVQHTVKIDSRLQRLDMADSEHKRKKRKTTDILSIFHHLHSTTPPAPKLLLTIQGSADMFNPQTRWVQSTHSPNLKSLLAE